MLTPIMNLHNIDVAEFLAVIPARAMSILLPARAISSTSDQSSASLSA